MQEILVAPEGDPQRFVHQAFLYSDPHAYAEAAVTFIDEGLSRNEPTMVAVPGPNLQLLRQELRASSDLLTMVSMEDLGRNPAWIIPAWNDFTASCGRSGVPARIVGEPVWSQRSPAELAECMRHEELLNVAFVGGPAITVMCPYDISALSADIIGDAHRYHPEVQDSHGLAPSSTFTSDVAPFLDTMLPDPPADARRFNVPVADFSSFRSVVASAASDAGMARDRVDDLLVAVSEAAANSVNHAGDTGSMQVWSDGERFVCDIIDAGRITDPLAGRCRPAPDRLGGRGLWLMHQLCDLVQIRALPQGQVIRLHMRLDHSSV